MKEVRRFEQRRSRLNSFLFVCSSSLRALIGRLDNKSCVYELVLPQSNFRKQEKKFVGIVGRRFIVKKTKRGSHRTFFEFWLCGVSKDIISLKKRFFLKKCRKMKSALNWLQARFRIHRDFLVKKENIDLVRCSFPIFSYHTFINTFTKTSLLEHSLQHGVHVIIIGFNTT